VDLDRRLIVSIAFISLSVGSAIYVSLATLNYLQFYPAIERLQTNVTKVSFVPGTSSNSPIVNAHIAVDNPTDYSGFKIRQVYFETFFFVQSNYNITLFGPHDRLNVSAMPPAQVPANSVIAFDVTIGLSSGQATQLASFDSTYSGQGVIAWTSLRVDISTFLVAATGTTILDRVQNVTLTI
jgi:hypothetical protein